MGRRFRFRVHHIFAARLLDFTRLIDRDALMLGGEQATRRGRR